MRNTLGQAVPTKAQKEEEERWRAEDDLRTLQRAAEVKSDEKRMAACMKLDAKQREEMKSILKKSPKGS